MIGMGVGRMGVVMSMGTDVQHLGGIERKCGRAGVDPLDVMVMTLLGGANLGLEAQNLGPVLAHLAIHRRVAGENLVEPLLEGRDHLWMIVEIGCLDELNRWMALGDFIGRIINALDENA